MINPTILPPEEPPDFPPDPPPQLVALAQAMYAAFSYHGGGSACSPWSEIKMHEHLCAGRTPHVAWATLRIEPDGVLAHWCYLAAVAVPADEWQARADAIAEKHVNSAVYQRLVG